MRVPPEQSPAATNSSLSAADFTASPTARSGQLRRQRIFAGGHSTSLKIGASEYILPSFELKDCNLDVYKMLFVGKV